MVEALGIHVVSCSVSEGSMGTCWLCVHIYLLEVHPITHTHAHTGTIMTGNEEQGYLQTGTHVQGSTTA